ncbi:MAG: hypothetical protein ACYC0X_26195 [Pirellulaceae bacterium]
MPSVETSYTTIRSSHSVRRRLKDLIPPHSVRHIVVNRLVASAAANPDHDGIIREVFASDRVSGEWGLFAGESVRVEYTIVTDEALFILSLCGEVHQETRMTAAILRGSGFACRFHLMMDTDRLAERIVVDSSEQSASSLGTFPDGDRNFQRRIAELRGRRIQDIVDLDQVRKIVRPQPYVARIGEKVVDLSDDVIVSALLTGRIVERSEMHYHLQRCREYVLEMPKQKISIGVCYRPVGYIRFDDDESYWLLFGDERIAPQHTDDEKQRSLVP